MQRGNENGNVRKVLGVAVGVRVKILFGLGSGRELSGHNHHENRVTNFYIYVSC
jgi:hypothetical protein